jgi:hypothetical protein
MCSLLQGAIRSTKRHTFCIGGIGGHITIKSGSFASLFYEYRDVLRAYDRFMYKSKLLSLQNVIGLRAPKLMPKTVDEIIKGYNLIAKNVFDCLKHKKHIHYGAEYNFDFLNPYMFSTFEEAERCNWNPRFICTRISEDFLHGIFTERFLEPRK